MLSCKHPDAIELIAEAIQAMENQRLKQSLKKLITKLPKPQLVALLSEQTEPALNTWLCRLLTPNRLMEVMFLPFGFFYPNVDMEVNVNILRNCEPT